MDIVHLLDIVVIVYITALKGGVIVLRLAFKLCNMLVCVQCKEEEEMLSCGSNES